MRGPEEQYVCWPSARGKPTFHKTLEGAKLDAEQALRDGATSAIVYKLVRVAEAQAIRIEWTDV